jgi:hypothetical protein
MEVLLFAMSGIGAVIGAFLFSYFRERGKNLATKEDVADITNRVEAVKALYTADQEKLKAQLHFLVSSQNSLYNDTKKAIFEFWEGTALLLSLSDPLRDEVDEDQIHEIDQYVREVQKASNELLMRHARLYFLVQDKGIIELSDLILKCVTRVQAKFELYVINAKPHIEEMLRIYKSPTETREAYMAAWKKVQEQEDIFDKEVDEFAEEMENAMTDFKQRSLVLLTTSLKV